MKDNVDISKQEILGRLVAAETDARHKVDEASLQAQQTVAEANATATQMLADARRQAAANAEALISRSKQEISDEVAALHMAADRRDRAMEEAARKNLDAAASLVVSRVTGEGG
jgi:vacuolar-type H+-ATPase subunit H